jgi:hypothetical protein
MCLRSTRRVEAGLARPERRRKFMICWVRAVPVDLTESAGWLWQAFFSF